MKPLSRPDRDKKDSSFLRKYNYKTIINTYEHNSLLSRCEELSKNDTCGKKILSQKFLQASILPPYIFTTSYSTLATHYVLFSFLCRE